jgi:predicted nucleotidyltransferase
VSTLLKQRHQQDGERREADRRRLLTRLREVLTELLPGETIWVFGSLAQPGRFGDHSDVDIALTRRPPRFSEFWLQGELELRLGRRVDVLVLPESRLRERIEREGERWTL